GRASGIERLQQRFRVRRRHRADDLEADWAHRRAGERARMTGTAASRVAVDSQRTDLVVAAAAVAAIGAWLWAFLATDRVGVLATLLAVAAVAFVLAQRAAPRYRRALTARPRVATSLVVLVVCAVAAALRDQSYPLLMLCTVLLFVVACVG